MMREKDAYLSDMNCIILIPSLEPDEQLPEYIDKLTSLGMMKIIVVDDGSGEGYRSIFCKLAEKGCVVLSHEKNLGKGCALKTGFRYIQEHLAELGNEFTCIVTVDADGQHAPEDVSRIAALSKENTNALTLGVRDFSAPGIPPKSLFGNRIASVLLTAFYGKHLPDTQTGLRAFGMPLLEMMTQISGDRFEYELQMLITCIRLHIPILTKTIQVIYKNANKGTHFNPITDSIRVIGTLLSTFLRFSLSSIVGAAVDLGIAWFLMDALRPFLPAEYLRILMATTIARIFSIGVNYLLNRRFVFNRQTALRKSLPRYLLLCAANIFLSSIGVYELRIQLGLSEKISKIICDGVLFLINYQIQQKWVFIDGKRS